MKFLACTQVWSQGLQQYVEAGGVLDLEEGPEVAELVEAGVLVEAVEYSQPMPAEGPQEETEDPGPEPESVIEPGEGRKQKKGRGG